MIIKKSSPKAIKVNENSTIWDYLMPSEETGVSFQNLCGRLPKEGWYRNIICKEIIIITKGKANICIENKNYEVQEGDLVILNPGEKHYGIYSSTSLITITFPNWYEEQCEILNN